MTKFTKYFLCFLLFYQLVQSQEIMIVDDMDFYSLNVQTCEQFFEFTVNESFFDIAYHPNGKLYGVNSFGHVYDINQMNGDVVKIFEFQVFSESGFFNSLTIDGDGLFYSVDNMDLVTYDLNTGNTNNLGDIGCLPLGDLLFYGGTLYCTCTNNDLVSINLSNPVNSSIVLNFNSDDLMYGLAVSSGGCEDFKMYSTGVEGGIYDVNLATGQTTKICQTNADMILGSGSLFEFTGFQPSESLIFSIAINHPSCNLENGSIQILENETTANWIVEMNGEAPLVNNAFGNLPNGLYELLFTNVGEECLPEQKVTVQLIEDGCVVYIPNAFSPNNDGLNDVFRVRAEDVSFVKSFQVFNRWGQLVFQARNFSSTATDIGWNGEFNNQASPIGVYLYVAEMERANGVTEIWKGNVTLLR